MDVGDVLRRIAWDVDEERLVGLLEDGLDLETRFRLWCHSSHGLQEHSLLSYAAELEHRHAGGADEDKRLSACLFVRSLLELGARPDTVGTAAAFFRCVPCLRAVLEAGADVDGTLTFWEQGETRRWTGIQRAYTMEAVQVYLEYNAAYDSQEMAQRPAKHDVEIADLLVVEIPLREENCAAALLAFLAACKFYYPALDFHVSRAIAKQYVWPSRRSSSWSFRYAKGYGRF